MSDNQNLDNIVDDNTDDDDNEDQLQMDDEEDEIPFDHDDFNKAVPSHQEPQPNVADDTRHLSSRSSFMSSSLFNITTYKQNLTRRLNNLQQLLNEANQYSPTRTYPSGATELKVYVATNKFKVTQLKRQIEEQTNKIWTLYESYIQAIQSSPENKSYEEAFNKYWEEKDGETKLSLATNIAQQLDKRATELECQDIAIKLTQNNSTNQNANTQETLIQPLNSLALEQRLLNCELKIPEFNGNPAEFGPFWELFEELVHKQPYSNIGKLSILLSCCKGDAARSLRMIPRTGDAYERAIQQLKNQYEDPKRITIQMIRQLKSMKRYTSRNSHNTKTRRSSDSTYMTTMVLETFPRNIQEEIARKEFDNGTE
ncbi:hypothetical protein OSTOST_10320 [Ostertagia ostertagi]